MIDLNKLTVEYLNQLIDECKIDVNKSSKKPSKIKAILNSGVSKSTLKTLYEKYLNLLQSSKKPTKKKKSSATTSLVKIEERLNLLEQQVKFLMLKVGGVEVKLEEERSFNVIGKSSDLNHIKDAIKSVVLPGDSITIDELIKINTLQNFSMKLIEKAIIELIDDEIFDASEGRSFQKVGKNIGRLIRR